MPSTLASVLVVPRMGALCRDAQAARIPASPRQVPGDAELQGGRVASGREPAGGGTGPTVQVREPVLGGGVQSHRSA